MGAQMVRWGPKPTDKPLHDDVIVVELDAQGHEIRRGLSTPSQTFVPLREVLCGADGALYQMAVTTSGVEVRQW